MTSSSVHSGAMARSASGNAPLGNVPVGRPAWRSRLVAALPAPQIVAVHAVLVVLGASLLAAAIVILVWPVDAGLANANDTIAGHDFIAFYAAGRLAAQGTPAAAYDLARVIATYFSILSVHPNWTPWAYPPPVFLLVAPLGHLSPVAGLALWYAVILGAAVAAVRLVAGSWRLGALGLVALPTVVNAAFGQNGTISAALLAAVVTCWTRAPLLAGVALGALAYKPHLAVVPGLLALARGAWRIVAAAAATVAVLVAASLVAYGPDLWPAWWSAVAGQMQYITDGRLPAFRLATIYVLMSRAGAPPLAAMAVHAAVAVAAFGACLWTWRRTTELFARTLMLALATLLLPPYAYDYDAAILLVPIAALVSGGAAAPALREAGARWLLVLSALPMMALLVAATLRISPLALLLVLTLVAAAAQLGSRPRDAALA